MQDGVWTVDPDGRTTFVNRRASDLLGVDSSDLVGRPAAASVVFGSPEPLVPAGSDVLSGALGHQEFHTRRPDGTDVWLDVATSPLLGDDGAFRGALATITDISTRFRSQREVLVLQAWQRALEQNAFEVVTAITAEGTIAYVTPAAEQLFGRPSAGLKGTRIYSLVFNDDQERFRLAIAGTIAKPGKNVSFDVRMVRDDGSFRWVEAVATNMLHEPGVGLVVIHGRDVTDRRLATARLNYQSLHDPLTDLPNRTLLRDRIAHALTRCPRAGTRVAVCAVGIDRFILINDTLGHPAGDMLLRQVGARLRACLRGGDTVAHLGGDQFTLVLENMPTTADAYQGAQRLLTEVFSEPFVVAGSTTHTSASIGVDVGDDRSTVDRLLTGADVAMRVAKRKGGARVEVYDRRFRAAAAARMDMETGLRRAIDNGQFAVAYQSVVSLLDRRIIGAEALVRWIHPERGTIEPMAFIPLAEETGLIEPIGAIVFDMACAQLRQTHLTDPAVPFSMSINVSPAQLGCHRTPRFLHVAERLGVDPTSLILEITEFSLVHDDDDMVASLQWLRTHGVRVAVDDFGTGYSSLSYLQKLPIDVVKIDRSFVAGLGPDPHDTAIVEAILSMAHALGLHVVAEGVETEQQLELLAALGCEDGQGFLFSRPVIPSPGAGLLGTLAEGGQVSGNIS